METVDPILGFGFLMLIIRFPKVPSESQRVVEGPLPSGCNVKHFASTIDCACSNNPHNEWLLSDCSNTELLTVELLALFGTIVRLPR